MSDSGYIKSYRKMKADGWFKNLTLVGFWHWCLHTAEFRQRKVKIGFQEITLEPGQFIFTYKTAITETGISMQTARTCIETLKNNKQINIQTTNKYSIITIVNWGSYQGCDTTRQQTKPQSTNKPVTNNQQTTAPTPIIEESIILKNNTKEEREVPKRPRAKKTSIPKKEYAEQVLLTDAEHAKLTQKYGASDVAGIIELLSLKKQAKGYTYKSDYAAILDWAAGAYFERKDTQPRAAPNGKDTRLSFDEERDQRALVDGAKFCLEKGGERDFLKYCDNNKLNPDEVKTWIQARYRN